MTTPLLAGLDVSRETTERLRALAELVTRWTGTINLVARSSLPDIWQRHILDSAQLVLLAPENPTSWVDLGSGGGFPGLVIGILAAEKWPGMSCLLIESDQRKATFLRSATRELGLDLRVLDDRIEAVPPQDAAVVSARALAPLDRLLPLVHRHLAGYGVALLPKGRAAADEIARAQREWRFALAIHDSLTDHDARILRIERIERA